MVWPATSRMDFERTGWKILRYNNGGNWNIIQEI